MSTLFLEAFGQLSGLPTIDSCEEDLYSVFSERAELMGWASTSNSHSRLWAMEEAELTADTDPYRIGWVQVGLGVGPVPIEARRVQSAPLSGISGWLTPSVRPRSTDPVQALAALVQCFSDSLCRFGEVELSGLQLQVTASYMETATVSSPSYLWSVRNWFNTNSKAGANAIVAFDQNLLGGHEVSELIATLQDRITCPFEFRTSATAVPEKHMVKVPDETPFYSAAPQLDTGVFVTLPEWTPSAIGWVLATVIDAARVSAPDVPDFAVRMTRV